MTYKIRFAVLASGSKGNACYVVVLAHLSETNNTPDKARASAEAALADTPGRRAEILVSVQNERGPLICF